MKLILAIITFSLSAFAQQTHQVTLVWTDTANPAGTTYNVYRFAGNCPATPPTLTALEGFAQINTAPIAAKSYVDTTVAGGTTYCYFATAVSGTQQSAPSPTAPAAVPSLYVPLISITVAQ